MKKQTNQQINDLINRLARISAAEHWVDDLNPAQLAALSYLAKANQYSRAPSQVAEYLSAMRGTVSGTLKALARKGLIKEHKSKTDKRRTRYDITKKGLKALEFTTSVDTALASMSEKQTGQLADTLKGFVKNVLTTRNDRNFGICATCKYHQITNSGPYCTMLNVPLMPVEAEEICFEHS